MSKRKVGERNWGEELDEYELHLPHHCSLEQDRQESNAHGLVSIRGHYYLRAADGRLEEIED